MDIVKGNMGWIEVLVGGPANLAQLSKEPGLFLAPRARASGGTGK
jgi:hypothetical protein